MNVTKIVDYHTRDTMTALHDLLRLSEAAGTSRASIAFVFQVGSEPHQVGVTGGYLDAPAVLLGCVSRMKHKINLLIDASNDGEVKPKKPRGAGRRGANSPR